MARRANWKDFLRLSIVTYPVVLLSAMRPHRRPPGTEYASKHFIRKGAYS